VTVVIDRPRIRSAVLTDAPALLAIYRPFVEDSIVSFETDAPTVEEFSGRIAKALAGWAWLVAEREGRCVGYAYASMYRERAAYRYSVETSAYVDPGAHGKGIGRTLYLALFEELARKGFCNALAGIALPNEASVAFHRSLGFEPIGVFTRVGRKFGAWHDVAWLERRLRDSPPAE
jgi:L-amino acid N-acyltransferase YncA